MKTESRREDEKRWASIAHAFMVVNIIPIVLGLATVGTMAIWLFKRRTSPYVGHQALQAFIFQAVFVFFAVITLSVSTIIGWLILLVGSGFALYAVYRCQRGEDFQYPVLGNLIASIKPRR